jgi:ferric-dicitrate binding protein FerR (iron transport regulator)
MFGHVTKNLTAYHHGELSEAQRRRVEAHTAKCSRCRAELEQVGFAVSMAGSLFPRSARIRRPARRELRVATLFSTGGVRFAVVAAAVILTVSLYAWRQSRLPFWEVNFANKVSRLRVGEWFETTGASDAIVRITDVGEIRVEPNSRMRILESRPQEQRMELQKGTIKAQVWAPPRLFFVETPSATAIDLGCAYTLNVDEAGNGLLRVTLGAVQLESAGRSSVVLLGWSAKTRRDAGPGTPFLVESPAAVQQALDVIDFGRDPAATASAVDLIVNEARDNDMVTLWHLLPRVDAGLRRKIYERMIALDSGPDGVTVEGIINLDPDMMNRWKSRLGLIW